MMKELYPDLAHAKFYVVFGYWKDDPSRRIDGYIVTNTISDELEEHLDDRIFFYGAHEEDLDEGDFGEEWVVEDYEEVRMCLDCGHVWPELENEECQGC